MTYAFIVTQEIGNSITGFFVDAETKELKLVNNRVFQISDESMLSRGPITIIKGARAKPFIAGIPREIWERENQPMPETKTVKQLTPEERMAKAKEKLMQQKEARSVSEPKIKKVKVITPEQPVVSKKKIPQIEFWFKSEIIGDPQFIIFKTNECKRN